MTMRGAGPQMSGSELGIAAVIPTRERPADLGRTVRSLLTQTVKPRQIVVVDQSADEESALRVRQEFAEAGATAMNPELLYIHDSSIRGSNAARNRGMAAQSADVVLFLDDDVVLEEPFLEALSETYKRYPEAAGVSGIITNYMAPGRAFRVWSSIFERGPFHDDRQPIYWRSAELAGKGPIRVTRFTGALMSFRAEAIRSRRFDENVSVTGDDVDFCMQLGRDAVLLITPDARLAHYHSASGRSRDHWLQILARKSWYLYRRNWDYGMGNRICAMWVVAGYLAAAAAIAIRRRSPEPFFWVFRGLREASAMAARRSAAMEATA